MVITYDIEAETMEDIEAYLDDFAAEKDDWTIEVIGSMVLIKKLNPMILNMEDGMDVVEQKQIMVSNNERVQMNKYIICWWEKHSMEMEAADVLEVKSKWTSMGDGKLIQIEAVEITEI